jgi:UDP-N-acetyl-2-amino-2-deoxyglucuronate dehydrogenase
MKFSIVGPSGYIANRHLKSIKQLNGTIISYLDLKKLDSMDESISFFSDKELYFNSFIDSKPDFCIICSPNHLHAQHINASLRAGVSVICEKPLCISSDELKSIQKTINETNLQVHSIMQLRLHPVADILSAISANIKKNKIAKISVITPRDKKYLESWKVKKEYSGGILFNLGIHYFDLLIQAFGNPVKSEVFFNDPLRAKGSTDFKNLKVEWFFSIDPSDQPPKSSPQRIFNIDNEEITFHEVGNDLHCENYLHILDGSNKFNLDNVLSTMSYMFTTNEE